MKLNKRFIYIFLGILTLPLNLLACENNIEHEAKKADAIRMNLGSIIESSNGAYSNLDYKDQKYQKIQNNNNEIIGLYDYKSNNYIIQSEDKYSSFCDNEKKDITNIEQGDNYFNLAPNGEKLFLFRANQIKIIDLKNDSLIEFKPNVLISGKLVDWIDEKTLVYYGVEPNQKINGIFTYDINTAEEKNIVTFSEGACEYIKTVNSNICFVYDKLNGQKQLKSYNLEESKETSISTQIKKVNDIINVNGDYYVLGSFKGMNNSLYKVTDGKSKRLVYGFPKAIKVNKGLSTNENGEILFIGSDGEEKTEEVYKCTTEGAVSQVYVGNGEISFLKN